MIPSISSFRQLYVLLCTSLVGLCFLSQPLAVAGMDRQSSVAITTGIVTTIITVVAGIVTAIISVVAGIVTTAVCFVANSAGQ